MKKTAGQVIFQVVKKLVKFTLFFFVEMVESRHRYEKKNTHNPIQAYDLYKKKIISDAEYVKSINNNG